MPSTVRELTEALYGNTPPALLATVQKLLDRMEAKECVARDRTKWPHQYSAALRREEFAGDRLQDTADQLFEGDLSPLLTHLVRSQKLTAKDREALRKVLDELDGKGSGKGK